MHVYVLYFFIQLIENVYFNAKKIEIRTLSLYLVQEVMES